MTDPQKGPVPVSASQPDDSGAPPDVASPDDDTLRNQQAIDTQINLQKALAARSGDRRWRFPDIEGYRFEAVIGRGGMGVVYRAIDEQLGRTVAIKTLQVAGDSDDARKRIENEARMLAAVQHPGVVQIFESGTFAESDGGNPVPYIAMEFVDGPGLDDYNDGNPLKPKDAAQIVYELARTLAVCHDNGVVHRDLKPANVLMASKSEPRLTDFGLARQLQGNARMTRTGEVMGTPGFMAPEQASGAVRNLGPSVDIYGLGAILYALLTGRPPFMAPDPMQTMIQVLTEPPVPPGQLQSRLPRDLEMIVLKCLEKKPRHRYETCAELAADLKAFLTGKPVSARPVPRHRKIMMWIRRHPSWSSLIGLAVAATVAIATGTAFHVNRLQSELDRSQRIILEGRSLSRWLLDDFTRVLEGNGGITWARSQLAERTQLYLDSLLKEAEHDEALKTELAYAYKRLAEIQGQVDAGSLGKTEEARANMDRARAILGDIEDQNSALATKVRLSINSFRIGELLEAGDLDDALEMTEQNEKLAEDSTSLTEQDRLAIGQECLGTRFFVANRRGDFDTMRDVVETLKASRDRILALPDADPYMQINSIVSTVRLEAQLFEPQKQFDETIAAVTVARKELDRLQVAFPDIDFDRYQVFLDTVLGEASTRRGDFEAGLEAYERALDRHERLLDVDASNQVTHYNVALAWQNVGETLFLLERHDETEEAYDEAERYFRSWANIAGTDLATDPAWLQLMGSRAENAGVSGDLQQALKYSTLELEGLKQLSEQDAMARRVYGDALLGAALLQAQVMAADPELSGQELLATIDGIIVAFEKARDQFDALDADGFGSDATRNQSANAQAMIDFFTEQQQKIRGGAGVTDF